MAVTNVFGERLWIEAAGTRSNESWQKWGMFLLAPKGGGAQSPDQTLILLPTAVQVQQGPPLEKVFFVRDEVANIAWAIEDTICLPNGETKPGLEAGRETRAFFQKQLEQSTNRNASSPEIAQEPSLRYTIMNSVPENWIPFIPVHVPNSSRAMQLQRAALPRILTGDTKKPQRVRPRTSMLSAGLDLRPRAPFYIFEEEVPRAGVCVTMRYNRARWRDGTVCVWLGMRKEIGRGERSSGLAFDQIVPVRQQS
jgi:hypothetical protein